MRIKYLLCGVAAIGASFVGAMSASAEDEPLANARDATSIYTDATAALAGGYELLTDAAGLACIEQPGVGAMGVHYVKGSLIQAGSLDAARPQALV